MAKLKFHGDLYENNNRVVNVSNASSATPSAPGTASAGSSTDYARADHTHAAQTTINGHTVGSDVPSVSSSDNGKLLGVSNGVLAAVDAPSGVFLVTLTGSPNPTSSDKTSGEIHTAYVNGQPVIAKWNSDVYYLTDSESTYAYFQYLSGSTSFYCSRISISTNSGSTTVTRNVVQWDKSSIPDVCEFGFTYNSSNQTYTYDDNSTFGQLYEYLWYGRKIKDSSIHITYPNSISDSLPSYEIGHCCEGWFDYEEIGGESNVPIGYAKYMVYVPGNGSNISSRIKMYSLVYNLDTQDPPTLTKVLDEEIGGHGGEPLIVNVTYNSSTYRYESSKTVAEINAAIANGTIVCASLTGFSRVYQLASYSASEIYFSYSIAANYTYYIKIYLYNSATYVTVQTSSITVPTVPSPIHPVRKIRIIPDENDQSGETYVVDTYNSDDTGAMYYWYSYAEQQYSSDFGGSIILTVGDDLVERNWNDPRGQNSTNADEERYQLIRRYSTYVPADHDYGSVTFTGHLVFGAVVDVNGTKKFKSWTVSCNMLSELDYATVTYSEETLGGNGETLIVVGTGSASRTLNHSFSEISAAITAGNPVYYKDGYYNQFYTLKSITSSAITFSGFRFENSWTPRIIACDEFTLYSSNPSTINNVSTYETYAFDPGAEVPLLSHLITITEDNGSYSLTGDLTMSLLCGNAVNSLQVKVEFYDETNDINEYYDFIKVYTTQDSLFETVYHAVFQCIINGNNGFVAKVFELSGYDEDFGSDITVTYTETSLSAPAAAGNSF